jgi:hypothetical protein
MKNRLIKLILPGLLFAIVSCEMQETNQVPLETDSNTLTLDPILIDPNLRDYLTKNGIHTNKVSLENERYIIDGCIIVTQEKLSSWGSKIGGESLQTRTDAQVSVPAGTIKTITYRISSSIPSATTSLVNNVIQKYNSIRNFNINFQETSSTNQDILFTTHGGSAFGLADWPTNGRIGTKVELNLAAFNSPSYNDNQKKFVIAHELGHTLGFRHTDWIQQSEGLYGVDDGIYKYIGATLIPATFDSDPYSIYNSGLVSSE